MTEIQSISTAGRSQSDEISERTRKYLITMGVRTVCFLAACLTRGWFQIVCIALTVILPYIAVIAANTAKRRTAPTPTFVDPHQIGAQSHQESNSATSAGDVEEK